MLGTRKKRIIELQVGVSIKNNHSSQTLSTRLIDKKSTMSIDYQYFVSFKTLPKIHKAVYNKNTF